MERDNRPMEDQVAGKSAPPGGLGSRIAINAENDIVVARSAGREMAKALGLGLADQTRLATAISELTRNVIRYAGTGSCTLADASDPVHHRIRVVVEDQGPGIPDLGAAMGDGYSTGKGLGAGLPGTKRLMSNFEIVSAPGMTKVSIEIVRKRI